MTFIKRLLAVLCLFAGMCYGQDTSNIPSKTAQPADVHEIDSVNLQDLSVNINVPVRSKIGAIPFTFSLAGNSQCAVASHGINNSIHDVECGMGLNKSANNVLYPPYQNWSLWETSNAKGWSRPLTYDDVKFGYTDQNGNFPVVGVPFLDPACCTSGENAALQLENQAVAATMIGMAVKGSMQAEDQAISDQITLGAVNESEAIMSHPLLAGEKSDASDFAAEWVKAQKDPGFTEDRPTSYGTTLSGGKNAGVGGETNPAQFMGLQRGVDPSWFQSILRVVMSMPVLW